ncbi:MAG: MarR family transcriptional regulator [Ruminococcaceae bacterium]|nr:MarR family transcriptional regulator [Oscillospiraceae bacterium]
MVHRYERFSSSVSGINRCIQKIEGDVMEKFGLRGSYAQYLAVLRRYEQGLTVSQLSDMCMKDKAAVSRAVAEMESKDLIYRQAEGDNFYRAAIQLTDNGKKIAEYVAERATSAVEVAGRGLTESEREAFYKALDLISSNLRDICKKGLPE